MNFFFNFSHIKKILADKFGWRFLFSVNVETSANEQLKLKDVEANMHFSMTFW